MRTILMVEDNKTLANAQSQMLKKHFNIAVDVAYDYAQAVSLIESNKYSMALLDLNLPDAPDGEIVDLVAKKIPSIVFTATYDESVRLKMIQKGVIDYFIKNGIEDFKKIITEIERFKTNKEKTILVVEDSSTIRHAIVAVLQRYNYHILEACDGQEALSVLAHHNDIDLIITDYNMPKMDGIELIKEVRSTHDKDKIAIIGLSADDQKSTSTQFLKYGANDFLRKPFEEDELLVRVQLNIELLDKIETVKMMVNQDLLTHTYNRRYIFDAGQKLYESAKRGHITLTTALIDIDDFKLINDTYGHEAGDKALKAVAGYLNERFRGSDIVARFDGEVFCVLAPNIPDDDVRHTFEEVRQAIEDIFITASSAHINITVSIGVNIILGKDIDDMISIAQDMLYKAKSEGKNCVEVY